jgi:hypothetical protein
MANRTDAVMMTPPQSQPSDGASQVRIGSRTSLSAEPDKGVNNPGVDAATKDVLKRVLSKYGRRGMHVLELHSRYHEFTNTSLNVADCGFKKLLDLLASVPDVVKVYTILALTNQMQYKSHSGDRNPMI